MELQSLEGSGTVAWARSPVTCEGLGFSLKTCISNKLLLLPVPWTQLPYSTTDQTMGQCWIVLWAKAETPASVVRGTPKEE